ncbi:50S ribosomal protein L25 [Methyloligella halotolerans]|uniref:Large ribosomal subunit protein bL25 n=1 Tax=Methyloligella halotolerans TaxID=1177755 RepID=A0A1E2RXK9_9HYPH|nr:50S ribosomal protein L25 [Methyloligella halotolerans]
MAEAHELKAWARERIGTGGARAVRREGRVPAIVYGDKGEPLPVAIDYTEVLKQLNTGHFQSTVYMLDLDGKKTRVIPRDVQRDPVKDFPMHVDFLRVSAHATINIDVPVHFLNEEESPGLKRGGVLNVVRHEVEVLCPVDSIPEAFEIDLTGLDIGDTIHVSAITIRRALHRPSTIATSPLPPSSPAAPRRPTRPRKRKPLRLKLPKPKRLRKARRRG